MAWESETASSSFNAENYTTNQIAGREGLRSGSVVSGVDRFGNNLARGFSNITGLNLSYSIVGMDMTKVGAAREAISNYVAGIESHLNNIDALADANKAYKSEEVQAAVKSYIEKVKEYCINLCSQLRAFSDKLADASAAWERATSNMASTVQSNTGSFDAGTRYTEQR